MMSKAPAQRMATTLHVRFLVVRKKQYLEQSRRKQIILARQESKSRVA